MSDWMMVNNELEWICKGTVVAKFKIPSRNIPGGTKENHNNISQNSK
jgi:hypothetical protein